MYKNKRSNSIKHMKINLQKKMFNHKKYLLTYRKE